MASAGAASAVGAGAQPGQVQVKKVVNGNWATVLDSGSDTQSTRLEFSGRPTTVTSLSLEYRKQGDTGPYLTKPAGTVTPVSSAVPGWFSVPYDDVANGDYEYRLTARDGTGALVNLTSVGGTAAGLAAGTFSVRRGGQTLPTMTATGAAGVVTPLTTLDHDIFGNVVHTVRFGKGAAVANETDYTVVGPDGANDQQRYTLYDVLGHAIKQVRPNFTLDQAPDAIATPLTVTPQYQSRNCLE